MRVWVSVRGRVRGRVRVRIRVRVRVRVRLHLSFALVLGYSSLPSLFVVVLPGPAHGPVRSAQYVPELLPLV